MESVIWICIAIVLSVLYEGTFASVLVTKDKDIPEARRHVKEQAQFACTVANQARGVRLVWSKLPNDKTAKSRSLTMDGIMTIRNPDVGNNKKKFEILTTHDVTKKQTTYTLVIRDIQKADNGTYQCLLMVRNVTHTQYPRANGRLLVLVPPTVTLTDKVVIAEEGENVTLDCKISGSPWPKVIWSHDTFRPLHSGAMMFEGNPYTIVGIERADAGGYNCSATNGVKPNAQATVIIKVSFPPEIKAMTTNVGQVSGKNKWSELRCSVASNPAAVLSWQFQKENNSKEIKNTDEKYDVTTASIVALHGKEEVHFMLKIHNVTDSDYGKYTCKAVNRFGNGDDTITFYETKTCQGPACENYVPPKKKPCNSNAKICVRISSDTMRSSKILVVIAAVLTFVQIQERWATS